MRRIGMRRIGMRRIEPWEPWPWRINGDVASGIPVSTHRRIRRVLDDQGLASR